MRQFVLIILLMSIQAEANWFARLDDKRPNKIRQCDRWSETLDEIWRLLETIHGRCVFRNEEGQAIKGAIFSCGPNKSFVFLRSKEDCERFKAEVNESKTAKLEAFVPKGTRNPGGWIVALNGCMKTGAVDGSVRNNGLQRMTNYCLCLASEVSRYTEKEIQLHTTKNSDVIVNAIGKCLSKEGAVISKAQEQEIRLRLNEQIQN